MAACKLNSRARRKRLFVSPLAIVMMIDKVPDELRQRGLNEHTSSRFGVGVFFVVVDFGGRSRWIMIVLRVIKCQKRES